MSKLIISLVGNNQQDTPFFCLPHTPEMTISPANNAAHYSTNFVLVRHRLELPNEKKETQDFYSLYMHLASLSESRDNARPTAFDPNKNKGTINVPNSPIAITAGELLGYIGQFSTGANNADTLHLEVFADTSLKQFINAGRHYDTTLPANQKPWLLAEHWAFVRSSFVNA